MAQIRLHLREADGDLPPACMCCGESATVTKTKKMQWYPPWVGVLIIAGILPYVIVASIMTRRARVQAPLCDRHQGHWFYRALLMWVSFFLFGILIIGGFVLATASPRHMQDTVFTFVCSGSSILLLVWLGIVIYAQNTGIRPKEITDTEILLQGVSPSFVDAVEQADLERRARKRERRSRSLEDEDEDEFPRPRNKRPPLDAIEE